jgi:acetylornithine deacetylase
MTERLEETTLILSDLVGFPTVTSEPNLELIDYLADRLETLGADIRLTHDESGSKANLFATIGPRVDGGVVLSGHSDVVPAAEPDWTGDPFVAMRRDHGVYGRGTADMKGFLACALAMAAEFATAPLKMPVHIAVTFDEEVGCRGAPILLDDLSKAGIRPAAAVIGEPTGMSLVTAHKGMHEYTTTITGRESHASLPAHGVNAVHYGARYVSRLLELATVLEERAHDTSPYDPPHTTISVGTISGGMARNVIAAECVVEWEMRPVRRDDANFVLEEIEEFTESLLAEMRLTDPAASVVMIAEGEVAGLEQDDGSHAIRLITDLVGGPGDVVSFGTEAGLYQAAGISAVVCGPGDIDVAHRPNEHIGLDQLAACLDFMERLMMKLSGN